MPIIGSVSSQSGKFPGVPTVGIATATSATTATVAFTPPSFTGKGGTVTYVATSSPGSITGSSSSSPITVSGLTAGTSYTFTVTSTNSLSTSAASSASNSITTSYPAVAAYLSDGITSLGGSPSNSTILRVQFSNDAVSSLSATYTTRERNRGCMSNSGVAGYLAGGGANNTTSIAKLNYTTEARTNISPTVNATGNQAGWSNSGTAGYSKDSGTGTAITKILYSNDTKVSVTFSGITDSGNYHDTFKFSNSGTAGYAGVFGASTISKFTFSSETWANTAATLSTSVQGYGNSGMANSGTAGYAPGGNTAGGVSQTLVNKLAFSNDTRSTLGTGLSATRATATGFGNKGVAGYVNWGYGSTGGLDFASRSTTDKYAFSNDSRSTFTTGTLSGYAGNAVSNEGSI